MAIKTYDTQKMRTIAQDIREKVTSFRASGTQIDEAVTEMHTYWDEDVNRNFTNRYNNELKTTSDSVAKLMEAYATFLEDAAGVYERLNRDGNAAIN